MSLPMAPVSRRRLPAAARGVRGQRQAALLCPGHLLTRKAEQNLWLLLTSWCWEFVQS